MICPKCQGHMRTFDRHGVHIERCEGCQGIFLDRGELEAIANAEQRHYGAVPPDPSVPPTPPPPPPAYPAQGGGYPAQGGYPARGGYGGYKDSPRPYGGYKDSPRPYGGYKDSPRPYGRKRRKSFLEDLFD
ncbi:zf-TFIIB domain-containing protein [Nocardiopsis aegyptia]|uniref:TFIIB-type zinc ribbon-containing protein n=1 Tax=Nocardiopsis aegyptia TaxID=220378 RepID=UPI00366A8295